jgi:hypothetical protein
METSTYRYVQLLTASFMSEVAIPSHFLYVGAIIDVVNRYNWYIVSNNNDWITLRRNRLYHN